MTKLLAGTALAALLDESGLRERFAGDAGLGERIATRRRAWDAVLAPAGLVPLALDLSAGGADDAQRPHPARRFDRLEEWLDGAVLLFRCELVCPKHNGEIDPGEPRKCTLKLMRGPHTLKSGG